MDQGADRWHTSSYSGEGKDCLDKGIFPNGKVAVRDTKHRGTGPVLSIGPAAWASFVRLAVAVED